MVDVFVVVGWTTQPKQLHDMRRYGLGPYPYRSSSSVICVWAFRCVAALSQWLVTGYKATRNQAHSSICNNFLAT
jgi:hypothetical protein